MSFQPPVILNMQASTGSAVQLIDGGVSFVGVTLRSGECYVRPIFVAPARSSTTCAQSIAAGAQTVTPASMTNIAVGAMLHIDANDPRETVIVTAVTSTTFTATFVYAHDGTSTPFIIYGGTYSNFSALPSASPAPALGAPRHGYWHLKTSTEGRTEGVEPAPVAGQVLFPGGSSDRTYALLIWTVTAGELEVVGH